MGYLSIVIFVALNIWTLLYQIVFVLHSIESRTRQPAKTKRCIIDKFQKVLLVLNFNFPYYENVKKLQAMYDGVFGQMVICGDISSAWKGSFPHIVKDTDNGEDQYVSYHCMGKAIEQYPGFEGEYNHIIDIDPTLNYLNPPFFRSRERGFLKGRNTEIDLLQNILLVVRRKYFSTPGYL